MQLEGKTVMYVLEKDQFRPAIVVRYHQFIATLVVFSDPETDTKYAQPFSVCGTEYSENKEPGTWHLIDNQGAGFMGEKPAKQPAHKQKLINPKFNPKNIPMPLKPR